MNRTYFHELNIDGVPFNKRVDVLFEDSLGFLWIGTNNGLYRYDGHNLVAYRYDVFDQNSIPNNSINSIAEDENQNLWIGSESYLIFFNRKDQVFKGYYKNSTLTVLRKSTDGTIWANRGNTSLIRILPHKNLDSIKFDTHFNYRDNKVLVSPEKPITIFLNDDFGRYWLTNSDGIFSFGNDYKLGSNSFNKNIVALKTGPNHTFLALTEDTMYVLGYRKNDRKLKILETYPNFLKIANKEMLPTSLDVNRIDNTLWVGTTNGLFRGLRTENQYTFEYLGHNVDKRGGLRSHQINTLKVDRYGNLWVGSLKGINKHIGRNSIFEYQEIHTKNNLASSLYLGKDNNILIGVNNDGLYKTNGDSSSKIFPSNNVFGVIKNNYGNKELLIGTGEILLKSRNFNFMAAEVQFDTIKTYKKTVIDVLPMNQDEIWVGLWGGGIDIINSNKEFSQFKKNVIDQLEGSNISVMLMDEHGTIWIGTRGEGLYKINLKKEELFHFLPVETERLSSNAILCLLEDGNKIWIGTRGGGLNVYDQTNNTFEWYGRKQGLRSTTISALQLDNVGNIWVSTQNGLARFDVLQKRFINFGMEDGVMESQFSFNSSAANNTEGILYFGCTNGYYTVNTKNFQQTTIRPQTVITSFKTLGVEKDGNNENQKPKSSILPLVLDKKIELPYNSNNIVIEFSSLDLTAPAKNEYAYILEGMNDYWIYTTASNRNANYNDLPPGDYTFKVKSSNSEGIWNEEPNTLSFSIAPPFWRSNWALFGYALLIVLCIWISAILVHRWYRLKKNLVAETVSRQKDNEHNRMKMVFFTDISHELRTPLTLILGTIEKIVKQRDFALSPLTAQRIHNNSLRMSRLINQIMDIRKFDVGEFRIGVAKNNFVKDILKIKNAFNDFAEIYHIKYALKIEEKKIMGWYDSDILEKILFNLLSNAFKYTPEKGEINITVKRISLNGKNTDFLSDEPRYGKHIICSVRDNGVGISKEDRQFIFDRYYQSTKIPTNQVPGTGIGMELVHKLIEYHHGSIKVESEENVFTEFTILLPLQKKHYAANEFQKDTTEPLKTKELEPIYDLKESFVKKENQDLKGKPKILIAEDNTELRLMLKEELIFDFHVIEASNGKEAYRLVVDKNPQLIISDIFMPIEDGISFLKKLKKNKEVSHIPIFMLTAKDSQEIKMECLALGADDYIEKPFSLEFVKWKVKNTLLTRKLLKEKYSKVITAEPSEIEVESNDEKFIKKLIRIIEDSIDDDLLSVEFLASEAGMSRANLYRKLQSILDDTPVNFIKKIRLKRAAQLLRHKTMYISEVAYRTGFSNQKYFGKCFSKEYGMSPTEYIKKYADKNKEDTINPSLKKMKL